MRRYLLLILLCWSVGCTTTSAQKTDRAATVPPETIERQAALQPAEPPPLLWKVSGPNGPLYLFGTMHFGVNPSELPETVHERMAACDLFVIEANIEGADPVKLADMMMLPDGPSIEERLGGQRWGRLLELLDGTFEPRVARRLRPWVLEAVLIQRVVAEEHPMEQALLSDAADRRMSVQYLEDWKTQVSTLNEAASVDGLAEIVDDPEGFARRMDEMTDDYVSGDIEALEGHIFDHEYAADALFARRNRAWIPRLEELVQRGDVFVAVGAGHLLGEQSVIRMLRDRGYEVERIGD